ncbi:hypothetical protein [Microcystis phage Mel-JY01]
MNESTVFSTLNTISIVHEIRMRFHNSDVDTQLPVGVRRRHNVNDSICERVYTLSREDKIMQRGTNDPITVQDFCNEFVDCISFTFSFKKDGWNTERTYITNNVISFSRRINPEQKVAYFHVKFSNGEEMYIMPLPGYESDDVHNDGGAWIIKQ